VSFIWALVDGFEDDKRPECEWTDKDEDDEDEEDDDDDEPPVLSSAALCAAICNVYTSGNKENQLIRTYYYVDRSGIINAVKMSPTTSSQPGTF